MWRALAQSGSPAQQASAVLFWLGVIVGVVVVCVVLALWLRRQLRVEEVDDTGDAVGVGFSLSDLRAMHLRGELSDEEFEHAKRRLVARTKAATLAAEEGEDEEEAGDGEVR